MDKGGEKDEVRNLYRYTFFIESWDELVSFRIDKLHFEICLYLEESDHGSCMWKLVYEHTNGAFFAGSNCEDTGVYIFSTYYGQSNI